MLRKFKVNVNGKDYIVEMEELTEGGAPTPPVAPIATTPAPAPVAVAPTAPVASVPATDVSGVKIDAPMPGNILKIMVNVGDAVSFEQPLLVLEAMKMENEIVSPQAGVVKGIHVTEGTMVDAGQAMITIG